FPLLTLSQQHRRDPAHGHTTDQETRDRRPAPAALGLALFLLVLLVLRAVGESGLRRLCERCEHGHRGHPAAAGDIAYLRRHRHPDRFYPWPHRLVDPARGVSGGPHRVIHGLAEFTAEQFAMTSGLLPLQT